MKKLLFVLLFIPQFIFAQDYLAKFTKLKQEIEYIKTQDHEIKSISISPNGNWSILYGDMGYSYNELPATATTYLEKINKKNYKINDFDLLNDSAWICISKHNAFALKYAPQSLVNKIKELHNNKSNIHQISYFNGKWAIIYDKGKVATYNVGTEVTQTINKLKSKNRLIKKFEFHKTGWIALYGKNEYSGKNIPAEAEVQLKQLQTQDAEINFITFYK